MGKKILCNIPCGWNVAKVEDIFYVLRGVTFPKSAKSEKADSYIGCLRTANVQQKVDWNDLWKIPEAYLTDEDKIVKEHDILISVANSLNLLGKSSYVSKVHQRSTFGTFIVNLRAKVDNPLLLYYFLQTRFFLDQVKDCASTTTNISNISTAKLKKLSVIVPPLPEQERIVAKIEELFSQLDAAVAELKSVKEKLAIYRQAVLKEAFEGNQQNGQQFCRIIDFADVQTGATPLTSRSDFYGGNIPWISSGKVNEEKIYEPSDWITELAIKETNCKIFPAHTILVAMYGEGKTRGKCAELMIAAATNQALAAIILRKDSCIIKEFLLLFLKYMYQEIRRKAVGGVQPNLNLTAVKNIEIPLFDKAKQEEIVMLIDEKLSICNNIEQTVNTALQQAAALRQSILKRAFEGNL